MLDEPLFFEDWRDAMRYVVQVLGGAKVVGAALRPEIKPDHAGRWLMDCLNADRRELLSPDYLLQLLRMARKAGVHAGMKFVAGESGYEMPRPLNLAQEKAALMSDAGALMESLDKITRRLERIEMAEKS